MAARAARFLLGRPKSCARLAIECPHPPCPSLDAQLVSLRRPPLDERCRRALVIIESGLSDRLEVGAVASAVGLSRYHLTRLLRQHCGMGFRSVVFAMRLRRARELLSSSIMSVKEIAVAVGYGSTATLDRAFRRAEGLSPCEYRGAIARSSAKVESPDLTRGLASASISPSVSDRLPIRNSAEMNRPAQGARRAGIS